MSAAEVGLIITVVSAIVLEVAGLYFCWKLWREASDQCRK